MESLWLPHCSVSITKKKKKKSLSWSYVMLGELYLDSFGVSSSLPLLNE